MKKLLLAVAGVTLACPALCARDLSAQNLSAQNLSAQNLSAQSLLSESLSAQNTTLCKPTVTPVPITPESQPARRIGPLPVGYVEEEYFLSCTVEATPYRTLIHVRRPADPAQQSGIVQAEIWHWGDLWTVYPKTLPYIARKHNTVIFMLSNARALAGIKKENPARYASLSLPWDTSIETAPQEFKVLTQIGALIKQGGVPHVTMRKLIMQGQSGSAGQVRRYIAQEGHIATLNGHSVFDGYFPAETAVSMSSSPIADQTVPVVEIQGETELLRSFEKRGFRAAYRRADGPLYRLYEVPGMSHISTLPTSLEFDRNWNCGPITVSDFPQEAIYMAALDLLIRWVDGGVAPPHLPRIQTSADGSVIERDAFGNALGGWRTPYLDVPFATYDVASSPGPQEAHGARCDMIGNIKRLNETTLKQLYPNHAAYVSKFDANLDRQVAAHWYLPEEATLARKEAQTASIP